MTTTAQRGVRSAIAVHRRYLRDCSLHLQVKCHLGVYIPNMLTKHSNEVGRRWNLSSSFFSSTSFTTDSALMNSRQMTGNDCYQNALDALKKAETRKHEIEQRRSKEQFEAWQKAQEKTASPRSKGIAIVKTIAKQSRKDIKKEEEEKGEWTDMARSWMEAAAFQHGHPKALIILGNDAMEEANKTVNVKGKKDISKEHIESLVHKAMELYEAAGEKGAAEGWFNLGHIMWTGYPSAEGESDTTTEDPEIIIAPDRNASLKLFERAIEMGDYDAMYFVGVQYLSSIEEHKEQLIAGLGFIQAAAAAKHGGALYYYALLHRNGNGALNITPCSPEKFVLLLDAAAQADNPDALFLRAHCSYHGEDGYKQDYHMSLRDFVSAAEAGNADAAVSAGAMLHQGTGVNRNQQRAFEMYQKAGEMGSVEGWRNVVACYALGEGVPECKQTAKYIAKTILKE